MKDNIIKSCVKWKDNNNQIQLEKPDLKTMMLL
jgi:hypothetical protein